ncbi:MAG: homoserine O-succinyltransferase [Pseudomonadota bacterium]|nr:homoserine O-succinyltransferase [Pseudomonadota bacterium]
MPIKVPDNLPALDDLLAEQVDVMAQRQALRQDIRPLRLLLLNLMPKKQETEIQFARLLGNSPLQIELILMTTASYTPRHTEPGYLRRFYRRLDDVREDFFDALIVTGAPVERLPFEEVAYWPELTEILEWSRTHCFRRLGICWGAQVLLYHFHDVPKYDCGDKLFGVYPHRLNHAQGRLMRGFTDSFPMPVSRYTENRKPDLTGAGIEVLGESDACGIGLARDPSNGDLFVLNHLEYDAETLGTEYVRDREQGLSTALPHGYFPGDDPEAEPVNFWRPYAFLLMNNWINDLYQTTPFDLSSLADAGAARQSPRRLVT